VTYFDEAGWQDMEEESADKFFSGHGHDFLFVPIGVVPPTKRNHSLFQFKDAFIADGNAVSITAEIVKDSLGSIKRGFGIDDPFFLIERSGEALESLRLSEMTHTVKEGQFAGLIAFFKIIEELIFEELRQDPYGEEESFSTGNPALFL
jgi:hypothetical protein